ncbi:MAG: pseudouridine synthase [Cyclobacteriaceae bacterium]|nr:pseudouridine synthase [Cyclobacteriaceae bacterium]
MEIDIIYQDEHLVAINKSHGLLVHRTKIANDADVFALQLLRDKINQKVYPAHRIDRKTSGVLLFVKSKEALSELREAFNSRTIIKKYVAIVRGHLDKVGIIDYALTENDKTQEAVTKYQVLQEFELPLPTGKFNTSRYSLIELHPQTGRFHQLRKHMAHIFHPIIGDRPHGCNKQNRLWKERFGMTTMLLHAKQLRFDFRGSTINIEADLSPQFRKALLVLHKSLK